MIVVVAGFLKPPPNNPSKERFAPLGAAAPFASRPGSPQGPPQAPARGDDGVGRASGGSGSRLHHKDGRPDQSLQPPAAFVCPAPREGESPPHPLPRPPVHVRHVATVQERAPKIRAGASRTRHHSDNAGYVLPRGVQHG